MSQSKGLNKINWQSNNIIQLFMTRTRKL